MIIKNYDTLASTPLRKKALQIIESGYKAIQTENVINSNVFLENTILHIKGSTYDLKSFKNIYFIAYGKSSFAAAKAIHSILGEKISKGYALGITSGGNVGNITTITGTHPAPSHVNVSATNKIIDLLRQATENDLILTVISGGGSALLTAPHGMSVEQKAAISTDLMNAGASIHELNYVRKHLSDIKGGRLAALAHPAKVVTLIFSDVPGNDLATIASGCTVMDPSTIADAQAVLDKYDTLKRLRLDHISFSESPKDPALFQHVDNLLLLDPTSAVTAMEKTAQSLGLNTKIYSTELEGDARTVGRELLDAISNGQAIIASGETTVNVNGNGTGGRNQEMILANLQSIKEGQVFIAAASDGYDHSNAGGAIADHLSYDKAVETGLDPDSFLQNSDSFTFFQKTGDYLDTGLLDSNIADMMLVVYENN